MLNIKLIKRRIKSAGNISQITRAMEMVAASKMKKAQDTALKGKPYADKIYQVVRELASKVDWRQHPLLSPGKESGKSLIILISTNKGLCGGLNTNLFRYLTNWLPKDMDAEFISVGNKGKNIIVKWNKKLVADFSQVPFSSDVPAITKLMVDGFNSGSYKDVFLVYNNFITALTQEPVKKLILPITRIEKGADEKEKKSILSATKGQEKTPFFPKCLIGFCLIIWKTSFGPPSMKLKRPNNPPE